MSEQKSPEVQMIPIENIRVINPRVRNRKKFEDIIANISKLGLKKPITISKRNGKNDQYDLVCGQGRLEAYIALEAKEVPAMVIKATKEECLLMSLVENIARRQTRAMDVVKEIASLKERGYKSNEIAQKTDLAVGYVREILTLYEKGEERLIQAVEKHQIPLSVAVMIAHSEDSDLQGKLQEAYSEKKLQGKALYKARKLIEQRRQYGKSLAPAKRGDKKKTRSADALVKAYQDEVQRQKLLIKKATLCEARLVFILSALKDLFQNENFVNLLKAESLDSMPKYLADRIKTVKGGS